MKYFVHFLLVTSVFFTTCQGDNIVDGGGIVESDEIIDPAYSVDPIIVCEGEEVPDVGVVPNGCFALTILDEYFYAFRGTYVKEIDLDDDGVVDVEFIADDRSYGIAGPTRAEILLVLKAGYEVERIYVESEYCTRWWYSNTEGPDSTELGFPIDARLCEQYTEEELASCDTVVVEEFGEFMVQAYELNDPIVEAGNDWQGDTVLIAHRPKQPGDFSYDGSMPYDDFQYMVFRKEEDGELKYGWLEIVLVNGYGVPGTIKSYGIMY